MKKLIVFAILLISLLLVIQIQAQEKSMRFGLGVSIGTELQNNDNERTTPLSIPTFYVPIILSPKFRIEPQIGFLIGTSSDDDKDQTNKMFSIGAGIFMQSRKGKADLYYGLRVGVLLSSYKIEVAPPDSAQQQPMGPFAPPPPQDESDSMTDIFIGPAIGGEYFVSDHLSVGGEIELQYIILGQYEENEDVSQSLMKVKPLIFVRWYY